jgi:hypothetical protein
MRRKKVEPFNPFAPRGGNPHQFQNFSDEWVKHNKWMGDENELMDKQKAYKLAVSLCRTKIRMPTFEEYIVNPRVMDDFIRNQPNFENFSPPVFFNFQSPVPVKKIRDEMKKYQDWADKQKEKMTIFEEMMNEKGIRAGTGSVGEAHKGWGRSKRKG